ncbi:MAG: CHAT domain-containing protein [Methanoregulaceae archaeon]|nr:MAG: CHAT domain-containing protein [Methanoregulaceae archaeon]RPI37001.1 MAG: CHAT domain-containing protein [Methanoregulaceae archaeon]
MPETPASPPHQPASREIRYKDFDVEIQKEPGGNYTVIVQQSPAGEAKEIIQFPFDEKKLERQQDKLRIALRRGRTRQICAEDEQPVKELGKELFDTIFPGEVGTRYDVSRQMARQEDMGLRLRLHLDAPEWVALPWEFLYDERQGDYICISRNTPVVRYLELPQEIKPLSVKPPLRILGLIASPNNLDPLDVKREKSLVETAIQPLKDRGLVELVWSEGHTWRALQQKMREGPWHIFHFIGHGGFDQVADEGFIALEADDGSTYPLPAQQLARLLADHTSLRLVVLNSCEGARSSQRDVISSTASVLVRSGIPAVVAMQYEISDQAAVEFARSFYESLAFGYPVDSSMAEARKAVSTAIIGTVEWGTPVLYLRSPDGVLFTIGQIPLPSPAPAPAPGPAEGPVKPALPGPAEPQVQKSGRFTEPLGIFLTGFIVMWLVFYFIVRFQQFTIEILGGIMAVIFGGLILHFIQLSNKKNVWNYPIGLFIGFIAFQVLAGSMYGAIGSPAPTSIPAGTVTPFPPHTTPGQATTIPPLTMSPTPRPTLATPQKTIPIGIPVQTIVGHTNASVTAPTAVSTTSPTKVPTPVPTTVATVTARTTIPVTAKPASQVPPVSPLVSMVAFFGILMVAGIGMSAWLSRRK